MSPARDDPEARLHRLEDLEEIRGLARRYAHHVWQRDVDAIAALFAPDGVMDTGDRPPLVGREAIRSTYAAILPRSDFRPFVHDHLVEIDGDRATGTCYLDLRITVEGRPSIGAGFYEDTYVRVDGAWLFASRKLRLGKLVPVAEGA